jgi:hypothetical protein
MFLQYIDSCSLYLQSFTYFSEMRTACAVVTANNSTC